MIKNYSEQESVDNFGAIQYDREQKYLNQKDLEQAQNNIGVKNIIDCVQSNSASWGGGTPIEMSGKLDSSAVGFGKYNSTDYVIGISGKEISARYAQTALKANNAGTASEAQYAYTSDVAYHDAENHPLQENYYNISSLSAFIQTNSGDWGGSSPTGENSPILFHKHYYYDHYGSTYDENFVSGASELNFRCGVDFYTQPQEISITRNGSEITRVYWTLVSSDGTYNYYSGSVSNLPTNDELGLVAGNSYTYCYVSANGNEIPLPYFDNVICPTSTNAKFNVQGINIAGRINGISLGVTTTLTSFTGNLNDFTFSGYEIYDWMINSDTYDNTYYYDVSAEFGGVAGSQVTSGDVLPNGPMDGNTYTLKWNTQSGLYWGV